MSLGLVERVVDEARTRDDVPRAAVDVVAQVHLLLTLVPVQDYLQTQQNTALKRKVK